jgi:hypothetical protein
MCYTNSPLDDLVETSLEAANIDKFLCSMRYTNSTLDGTIGTSRMAAPFPPRYVCLVNRLGFLLCTQRRRRGDKFLTMTASSTTGRSTGRWRDDDEWISLAVGIVPKGRDDSSRGIFILAGSSKWCSPHGCWMSVMNNLYEFPSFVKEQRQHQRSARICVYITIIYTLITNLIAWLIILHI